MIEKITTEQVKQWKYLHDTPAGGKLYFSDDLDMCAVVYGGKTKLFYTRNRDGFTPHCFDDLKEI
jgi:hypothetical protein